MVVQKLFSGSPAAVRIAPFFIFVLVTVAQEKIALLQKFLGSSSNSDQTSAEYKQMLSDEQQKLQDAKAKLGQ